MDLFDKYAALPGLHEQIVEHGVDPFGICMERMLSATRAIVNGKETVLAGTNNYLGLTFEPECIEAATEALATFGTGTTGSRIANGTYSGHRDLERELADFLGCNSAILFPTGYQANFGIISTLVGPDDTVFLDADCHACIYDGALMTGATVIRFKHNSADDLERRMRRLGNTDTNKLIIVEGLYSMFGDVAPLAEIAEVKRRYGAYLYVDEAHSLGVFGETGRGVAEAQGVSEDVDFVVGTFSKSLGAIGGFCASSHPKFELLRIASRPYMFTASLSPSNVASVYAALRKIRREPQLMGTLWSNSYLLYDYLKAAELDVCAEAGPIIAVQMPSLEVAVKMWNLLLNSGVYVNLAIPPGTPNSTFLLRCSVSAAHTEEEIQIIGEAFQQVALSSQQLQRDSAPAKRQYAVAQAGE